MGDVINNLHNTVKIAVSILLFCVFPLAAYLIFIFRPELFQLLDIFKLSLIALGIISPITFLNTAFLLFIIKPTNSELANRYKHDNPLGASLMLSLAFSMLFAILILMMALLGASEGKSVWTLLGGEILLLAILTHTIIRERV